MKKIGGNPNTLIGVLSVLLVGVLCQSSGAENPALAYMAADFPELPFSTITAVSTVPSLMMIPASLAYSFLRRRFGFRPLFVAGALLLTIGGVAPAWANSFQEVLAWRAVFGLGVGMMWPLAQSMIVELYNGNKQDSLLGWNSVVTALGGIVWSNVGGVLALHGWRTAFFTYFIPVAVLVFCGIFMPDPGPASKGAGSATDDLEGGRSRKRTIGFIILIFAGYFVYNFCNMTYFTNISMKVVGEGLGDSAAAGLASSFYTVGSLIIGVLFGRAMRNRWFSRYSMAVGWISSAIGMMIVGVAPSFLAVVLGSMIQGFGTGTFMPTMVGMIGNVAGRGNASLTLGLSMCLVGASQFFGPTLFNLIAEGLGMASGGACIVLSAGVQFAFALLGTIVLVVARRSESKGESASA